MKGSRGIGDDIRTGARTPLLPALVEGGTPANLPGNDKGYKMSWEISGVAGVGPAQFWLRPETIYEDKLERVNEF